MNIENLVGMANRIGEFFEAMPDRDGALHGTSDHIRMFWAPRMREQLTAHCAGLQAPTITPFVAEALALYPVLPKPVPLEANDPRPAEERHQWDGASES